MSFNIHVSEVMKLEFQGLTPDEILEVLIRVVRVATAASNFETSLKVGH
jgi:hypothetical protein